MNDSHPATQHPFNRLQPDLILDAIESCGVICDGRILELNSYENRVFQIGIEDESPLIAKFYRPDRWSDDQIREEHAFSFALARQELPVVTPLKNSRGDSLHFTEGFRLALYPRRGGHAPELDNLKNLEVLGRQLAQIHNVGATHSYQHRPAISLESFGYQTARFLQQNFIPIELQSSWQALTENLLETINQKLQAFPVTLLRVHGDCHSGNILWRDEAPHFIDLDDSRMAPAIQDLWMLLSGETVRQQVQLDAILKGYRDFRAFDPTELHWIQPLRTLRMLHFSAWIGQRWDDPAFPRAFPWFNNQRYWGELILDLKMQLAELSEPPLQITP